jgi:hypothetical protein
LIDRRALLADLQKLLPKLEADLLERTGSAEVPDVGRKLRDEFAAAQSAQRTAQNFEDWRSDAITQVAAAWVLSCVFVRFLEDNQLVPLPKIAGPGDGLKRARDQHELYFRSHPTHTDRDYLLSVFDGLSSFAATRDVFGPHNPIRDLPNWLSGDAAGTLLAFFQKIDPNTGNLVHDFTDRNWDTRFLGDLYQDLSEAAQKKYALLQTPVFVEEFILDRTLDPALEEFGLATPGYESRLLPDGRLHPDDRFKLIDPACGSGHFLLGSFARLVDRWQRKEPGTITAVLVQRALDSVHGVDLNPYAIAIARFRLLLAALRKCGIVRLGDAPAFEIHLACGDSLLHGSVRAVQQMFDVADELRHVYQPEDSEALGRLLQPGRYHGVVANPPYITPKDPALNAAYRERYVTCYRLYSLAVPFLERIVSLAVDGGFTGQITANSFMKREFGKKLIEEFFPRADLTHVIDTSGAHIPGHGTPTVILLIRNRRPLENTLRTVLGIRGEPTTPDDPAQGLVWTAIVAQVDEAGSGSEFVTACDSPRGLFHRHPWSIGGGGAAELKASLDLVSTIRLADRCNDVGFGALTREDEAYVVGRGAALRRRVEAEEVIQMVQGENVRDWAIRNPPEAIWPYDPATLVAEGSEQLRRFLWSWRQQLSIRVAFGQTQVQRGLRWFEYSMFFKDRYRAPFSIACANIATHPSFVLDTGGKLFSSTAPILKLPSGATAEEHLGIIGLLNSSTSCFWYKQVFQTKGSSGIGRGVYDESWEKHYQNDGTKLKSFPLVDAGEDLLPLARALDSLANNLKELSPPEAVKKELPSAKQLALQRAEASCIQHRMIALQEELDWQCYRLYSLIEEEVTCSDEPPPISLGQRPFEIVLARKVAAGEEQTTWFERHGSTPITEVPSDWPEWYGKVVERRIELIATNPNIALIERPEYKRRWNTEPWESQLEGALREWLLDRLEGYFDFDGRMKGDAGRDAPSSGPSGHLLPGGAKGTDGSPPSGPSGHLPPQGGKASALPIALISVAKLADVARRDADFRQVGEIYRDDPAFDVERLVAELVEAESVPLLPILRYKATGLRKREEWEKTWDLQRQEDAIDARSKLPRDHRDYLSEIDAEAIKKKQVGTIPVPPKYKSEDLQKTDYWRLRGKLDVPKERWVSFPHCEGEDGTLMIAWAGYDHLQLARAISAYYVDVQERLGGRDDPRLVPLLACLIELLPWLKQWHNEVDPEFGLPMGDYFEGFVQEESRNLGMTLDQIRAWQPPQRSGRRPRSATTRTPRRKRQPEDAE